MNRSHGDIRSLLNLAQSADAQYMTDKEQVLEIDIGSAINAFFAETNLDNAKNILARSDSHYIDPGTAYLLKIGEGIFCMLSIQVLFRLAH